MPDAEHSLFGDGKLGYHLTIHLSPNKSKSGKKPDPSLQFLASHQRVALSRGIKLNDREMKLLLSSWRQGVGTINSILVRSELSLGPELRLKLSEYIVDAMMSRSLKTQLSSDHPDTLDRLESQDAHLRTVLDEGPSPSLIRSLGEHVGASVTLTFDLPWLSGKL